MHDIVYLIRPGENNEEFRHSLRSLEKNFPNHGTIWIVGYCPLWINKENVRVIYKTQVRQKWVNTDNNLKVACRHPDISDDFILMNDDFFIMQPIDEIPRLNRGSISEVIKQHEGKSNSEAYAWSMRHTTVLLQKMGIKDPLSYELHVPMIINKEKYLEAVAIRNKLEPTVGRINKRTLYGNYVGYGGETIEDVKISYVNGKNLPKDSTFISTNDESFKFGTIGHRIREAFNKPCRYEVA